MKGLRIVALGVVAALLAPPAIVEGHSGGLDGCGCHAGSRPYHCHRDPCRYCPESFNCAGKIRLVTIPKARVFVDGKDRGVSPTKPFQAQHGSVRVRLEHPILGSKTIQVLSEYGATRTRIVRW